MGTNLKQSKAAAGMTVTKGPIDLAQCDRSLSVVSLLPESTRRYREQLVIEPTFQGSGSAMTFPLGNSRRRQPRSPA
jgi:hypothetical protein